MRIALQCAKVAHAAIILVTTTTHLLSLPLFDSPHSYPVFFPSFLTIHRAFFPYSVSHSYPHPTEDRLGEDVGTDEEEEGYNFICKVILD